MKAQIKNFGEAVREVVRCTMLSQDAVFFQPNRSKKARLKGLGIETYLAMVNLRVVINDDAKKR